MRDECGTLSLPFRLAISMMVVALSVPLCLQSLDVFEGELARRTAANLADEIASVAERLSWGHPGESVRLEIHRTAEMLGSRTFLFVGGPPGSLDASLIRCAGADGWSRTYLVNLAPGTDGICSVSYAAALIDRHSRQVLLMSQELEAGVMMILVEA